MVLSTFNKLGRYLLPGFSMQAGLGPVNFTWAWSLEIRGSRSTVISTGGWALFAQLISRSLSTFPGRLIRFRMEVRQCEIDPR